MIGCSAINMSVVRDNWYYSAYGDIAVSYRVLLMIYDKMNLTKTCRDNGCTVTS